jgi:hypothetical protein
MEKFCADQIHSSSRGYDRLYLGGLCFIDSFGFTYQPGVAVNTVTFLTVAALRYWVIYSHMIKPF